MQGQSVPGRVQRREKTRDGGSVALGADLEMLRLLPVTNSEAVSARPLSGRTSRRSQGCPLSTAGDAVQLLAAGDTALARDEGAKQCAEDTDTVAKGVALYQGGHL